MMFSLLAACSWLAADPLDKPYTESVEVAERKPAVEPALEVEPKKWSPVRAPIEPEKRVGAEIRRKDGTLVDVNRGRRTRSEVRKQGNGGPRPANVPVIIKGNSTAADVRYQVNQEERGTEVE